MCFHQIGAYKDDGGVTHPILGSLLFGDKPSHGASREVRTTVAVCPLCFQLYQVRVYNVSIYIQVCVEERVCLITYSPTVLVV
jgi:hypothetical protein